MDFFAKEIASMMGFLVSSGKIMIVLFGDVFDIEKIEN